MADRRRGSGGGGGPEAKRAKTQRGARGPRGAKEEKISNVDDLLAATQQDKEPTTWDTIDPEERSNALLRARERDVTGDAHTLESDEEDEDEKEPEKKYELKEEDMHETLDEEFQNGGYALTGFNLEDELEEGHFDEEGTFHFKKDEDHAGDAWLEGVEVYKGPRREDEPEGGENGNGNGDATEDIDRYVIMEEMLQLMKEQETVNESIKRLDAASKPPRQTKQRKRKQQQQQQHQGGDQGGETQEQKDAREKAKKDLTRLIELADKLMQDGVFTIYEDTYEKLVHEIKEKDVATFEYKWTNDEDAEVFGPFTAQQMADWQEAGFFKDGVWARQLKKGRNAKFYHSSRIDFDLYT